MIQSDDMKTKASKRTMPLVPFVKDRLLALKQEQEYQRKLYNLRNDRDVTEKELGSLINKSQQGYDNIEKNRAFS